MKKEIGHEEILKGLTDFCKQMLQPTISHFNYWKIVRDFQENLNNTTNLVITEGLISYSTLHGTFNKNTT